MARESIKSLRAEIEDLRLRLEEAEQALEAIRTGQVESLVVEGPNGPRIFSLEGASHSYRILVEAMSEGAATLSEDGTLLYCNARFAHMLNAPLERVMGGALNEWAPEDLRVSLDALLWQARDGEARGEMLLRAQGGQDIPVHFSVSTIHDDGRRVFCLVATDLREQKQNEQILAEGRLARSVLEQAEDAIVVCDERGRITRVSRAAEQLCGCCPLRAHFDAAFPVELSSPLLSGGLALNALKGTVFRAEPATLTRVDGSRADLLASATPLQGADRRIIGCVVTMVDVSEHRRAEQALRASEERLRTLGDNLPDGAVFRYALGAEEKGHFIHISAGIERLVGVAARDIQRDAVALLDAIIPDDRARLAQAEARSAETMKPFEIELRLRHRATGEIRRVLVRSVPRRMPDGCTEWDGLYFDITERRKSDETPPPDGDAGVDMGRKMREKNA
jgi:PAS domain S-box-containing protein